MNRRLEAWNAIFKRKGLAGGLGSLANAVVIKHALRAKALSPLGGGLPTLLSLSVSSRCNLRCVGCFTHGYPDAPAQRPDLAVPFLSLAGFQSILAQGGSRAHILDLTSPGESFLNPEIYSIIALGAHGHGMYVKVDTNGHAIDAEAVVESGLGSLTFALDGFSQESYASYRVRGEIEKVKTNIEKVSQIAASRGSQLHIGVKFLVHSRTENEVETAREYYSQLPNVHFFTDVFIPPGPTWDFRREHPFATTEQVFKAWQTHDATRNLFHEDPASGLYVHRCLKLPHQDLCPNPYVGMYINTGGNAYPCCIAAAYMTEDMLLGNVHDVGLRAAFSGPQARAFRSRYKQSLGKYSLCAECWANRATKP